MNDEVEGGVVQLVLVAVYAMFIYKLLLFCVMWKASLNFKKFVE